jgi:hypothetical protein
MLVEVQTYIATDPEADLGDWGVMALPKRRISGTPAQIGLSIADILLSEREDKKVPVGIAMAVRPDPEVLDGR